MEDHEILDVCMENSYDLIMGKKSLDEILESSEVPYWTLTGLTAGDSEELWIGFASQSTTGTPNLFWGSNGTGRYPDFIMKATALPASITT